MGRIITFIIFATITVGINVKAQVLSTKSRKITITKEHKERKPIPWKWYAKGGIALMNGGFADSYNPEGSKISVGYNFAGGFQWKINQTDWYWGSQIGLGMVATKYDFMSRFYSSLKEVPETPTNLDYHYQRDIKSNGYTLSLGPQLGRKLQINKYLLDIHFGINIELVFAESSRANKYTNKYDNTAKIYYWEEEIDNHYFEYPRITSGDIAISPEIGIGMWFNKILIELSYRHGFWVAHEYNIKYYNNLMLSVGYQF